MKWLKRIHRDEKGVVLIGALIVLVFVAIAIVPALNLTASHLDQTTSEKQEAFDVYAADAGFQQALFEFATGKLQVPAGGQASIAAMTINGRDVTATVESVGDSQYKITSVATNTSSHTYTVEAYIQTGLGVFDFALASTDGDITISGNTVVTSSPDPMEGDIHANGGVGVSGNADVQGDATATETVTDNASPGVAGTAQGGSGFIDPPFLDAGEYLIEASLGGTHSGDMTIDASGTHTLGPIYITGNLLIAGQATVELAGTVYVDGTIAVEGQSQIEGCHAVVAEGDINLTGQEKLDPGAIPFIVSLNGNITIAGTSWTSAVVYAMNGDIVLGGGSKIYGAAVGENVSAGGNPEVEYCTELSDHPEIPQGDNFRLVALQHG